MSEIALFTKSYAGDLALCTRLCASIDRTMPGLPHYLVVDRVDRPLFAPLVRGARVLVESEAHLPGLWQTQLFGRRLWLSAAGPPVRGWIQQQLAKLAVVATLPETAVVMVDSDVEFLRPLDPAALLREGRTRLYRAPGAGQGPGHRAWHRVAARVLGLPATDYFGADYIANAVTWRPEVVRALLARIAAVTHLPWRVALTWRWRFSEYILYGVFAEHVAGPHRDLLFPDTADLCHSSWHYDLGTPAGRAAFLGGLAPQHAAVLLQSNLGLSLDARDALMAALGASR